MKNSLITGILLIVIGGLITKFVFNDKSELRYILSERIPSNFFDGNDYESIQQLELQNTGDIEINRIIVKIKANVIEYYIQKITSSDSVIITKSNGMIEFLYPQIPPDGKIKIITKTAGAGFDNQSIDIKHSKGTAKQALEKNNSISIISIGLMFVYLLFAIYGLRNISIDSIASKVYYRPFEQILKKSKPWYVPTSRWEKIREDSIKHAFENDYSTNIINSNYYQFLNIDRHEKIRDDEWLKLKLGAQKKLLNKISEGINKGHSWKMDEYLRLNRPSKIDEDIWSDIISFISKAYVTTMILDVRNYSNQQEIESLLVAEKPEKILQKDWEQYQSFLKHSLRLKKLSIENELMQEQFSLLLYGNELKEKPKKLSDKDWEMLKKIETNIFKKSKEIKEEIIELKILKGEVVPLKEKLEKQLKIINDVLTDPKAIDRIEDYSNPFSPGNFENLRLIAELKSKK